MEQVTLWVLGIAISVHVLLASVTLVFLYKDREISVRTKIVHGLLAWLVPFIGGAFSINSFFSLNGGSEVPQSYKHDFTYGNNELGDGGGDGGD